MKPEIRVLGIDDAPFSRNSGDVLVVSTVYRGGRFLDGVLSTKVRKDGTNSTQKLIDLINKCKFKTQLKAVLLDGIALAGFNIVDINKLYMSTKIPVIVIMRKFPDIPSMHTALVKMKKAKRIALLEMAGRICEYKKVFFQAAGIDESEAKHVIDISTSNSDIPEAIRVAHIIAGGIVDGESRGSA